MSRIALRMSFILLIFATAGFSGARADSGEKYAFLVGVRNYDKNELRSLPYTEADVTALGEILKQAGYRERNIVLMTQTRGGEDDRYFPRAVEIRRELRLLLKGLHEHDSVIVAFAGHGVQFKGKKEIYFCPAGTRLADTKTLVSLTEVYEELGRCQAGFKLLLSDACRNDPQTAHSRGRDEVELESATRPQRKKPPIGVAALFSCSAGERAYEAKQLKHGVFFHYVIKGLQGVADANNDGQVTLAELEEYTQKNVYDFVRAEYGRAQQPERTGTTRRAPLVHVNRFLSHYISGMANRKKYAYEKAVADFNEAIAANGRYVPAYIGRAEAYIAVEQIDKAFEDCNAALRLDPRLAEAYAFRARCHDFKLQFKQGLADCMKALELNPRLALAYACRGEIYADLKDYARALSDCDRAIRLDPNLFLAYRNRAYTYTKKRDFDKALADYNYLIRLYKSNPSVYMERADCYRLKGHTGRAIRDCDEAIRLNSKNPSAFRQRGLTYSDMGENDKALRDLDEAIRLNRKDPEAYTFRANIYNVKQDPDRAIEDCDEAIRLVTKNSFTYGVRGSAYNLKNEYDRALKDLDKAIQLESDYYWFYRERGTTYYFKEDYDRAIKDYDTESSVRKATVFF